MSELFRVPVRRNLDSSSQCCLTEHLRRVGSSTVAALAVLAALFLFADKVDATAEATTSVTPPSLSLTVGIPGDSLQVTPSLVSTGPANSFFADGSVQPSDFTLDYSLSVVTDPSVSGTFTLKNFSAQTQTFSISVTIGASPLAGPTAVSGSYGPGQLTAPVGTPEAQLTANPFFEAMIDGAPVQTLGSNLSITTSGGTAVIPMQSFTNFPGPAVTSSVSAEFPAFTLTALDTVEIPFAVTVTPEPASVALVVPGLAMLFIRWRAQRHRIRRHA